MKHQTITVPLLGSFMVPDFEIRVKHALLIVSQMTNASWNSPFSLGSHLYHTFEVMFSYSLCNN